MLEGNYKELYHRFKKENEELRILNNVLTQVTRSYDLDKLFNYTLDAALKHLMLQAGGILIVEEEQEELVLHTYKGYPTEYALNIRSMRYRRKMGLAGLAWDSCGPIYCQDIENDPRSLRCEEMGRAGYKSGLVIPMIYKGKVLGVMELLSRESKEFTLQEIEFLSTLCSELAIAVDYQRTYRESMAMKMELTARLEEIKVMNEIDRLVLQGSDSSDNGFLEPLVHLFKRVIPCEKASIYLVDRDKEGFRLGEGWGLNGEGREFIPFRETSLTRTIETGMVDSRPDLTLEKELLPFDKKMLEAGLLSDVKAPLVSNGKVIGVLHLASFRAGGFTQNHLHLTEKLSAQVSVALSSLEAYKDTKAIFIGTTKALASAIEEKDPFTKGHSERVSRLAVEVGKGLELDNNTTNNLMLAALLHDIGKIGVPDKILNKPSHLTREEYNLVKEHTKKGAKILEPISQLKNIIPSVLYHHETFDGKGYPEGLRGRDIPLGARIIKVCDAYDAMTSARPYREAKPKEEAVSEIKKYSGRQFDPEVAQALLSLQPS